MNQLLKNSFKYWQIIFSIETLSVMVLSITLLTPTWIYIVQNGTKNEINAIKKSAKIAAFLKQDTNNADLKKIVLEIKNNKLVKSVETLSSAKATEIFKKQSGLKNKLDILGDEVLPATIFIEPVGLHQQDGLDELVAKITALEQIEFATLDSYWSLKLDTLLSVLQRFFTIVTWSFVLVFVMVVFFVTKVLLGTVINEIKLKLLLGSTHNKINAHFVIKSCYLGTISALICLIITWGGVGFLDIPLAKFIGQFGVNIGLNMLNITESLVFIALSTFLYATTTWATCSIVLYQIDNNLQQADKF